MSITFAKPGRTRMVVVSDSRGTGPRGTVDDLDKLYAAGRHTVLAITGAYCSEIASFMRAFCRRQARFEAVPARPMGVLASLRHELAPKLTKALRADPECAEWQHAKGGTLFFGACCVYRSDDGSVDLSELRFNLSRSGDQFTVTPEIIDHVRNERRPFAYTAIPDGIGRYGALIDADASDERLLCSVDAAVDFARRAPHGDEIGGPIDVAVIESGGVRWLRRKPGAPVSRSTVLVALLFGIGITAVFAPPVTLIGIAAGAAVLAIVGRFTPIVDGWIALWAKVSSPFGGGVSAGDKEQGKEGTS